MYFFCFVLIAGVLFRAYMRSKIAHAIDRQGRMLKNFSTTKNIIKAALFILGIVFIFCALAHPRWGDKKESIAQQTRDIFIALDTSRSMLASDVPGLRLHCAQIAIKKILQKLACDRVGLMLFCDKAHVYCPLTRDHELVRLFVDTIDSTSIVPGDTRLEEPVLTAIAQCARCPERKNRLLILVTDGEDLAGNLRAISQKATQELLTILVVGIGTTQGAPIALRDEAGKIIDYVKDKNNKVVISKLHEGALAQLAHQTGGIYCAVKDENPNIDEIIQAVQAREKELLEQQQLVSKQEQYVWFVLASFVCFALEWII